MKPNPTPTLRELYPHFTEHELAEAEDNVERYLALMLRIFDRLEAEAAPSPDPLSPDPDVIQCSLPDSAPLPRPLPHP